MESLASVTAHDGTLYVLCFSDDGPDAGPHPVSREALSAAFNTSTGWDVAAIEPDRVQTRFHDDGAPAWLATIKRVNDDLHDTIAACSLDAGGMRSQRDRYATIGAAAVRVQRTPTSLAVTVAPTVDQRLVERTLAIERECCPFFELAYDPASHTLTIAVSDDEHAPALDALADAIAARRVGGT